MGRGHSRDKLLETGLELFGQRGYSATGVQEIADAGGVPKGSFYNYFASKEQFAVAVLERYQREECALLEQQLARGGGRPLDDLRAAFEAFTDQIVAGGFSGGCLAGRLAQELAGEHPELRQPLDRVLSCIDSYVTRCLERAREEGDLGPEEDVAALAEYIHNGWQGAMLRAKAAHSDRPLRRFLTVTFERLLGPESTPGRKRTASPRPRAGGTQAPEHDPLT